MANSKISSLVLRSSVVAALGGLLFGFDTAVISGTTDALTNVFDLTKGQLGFTVSSALIGTILGAATIQYPANKWGRKPTLVLIALLYFISAIGSAFPRMLTFYAHSTTLDVHVFPYYRRIRRRRRVRCFASLYSGNCASKTARVPRSSYAIQHCFRYTCRLRQQLDYWLLQPWRIDLAADVWSRGNSRVPVFCRPCSKSGKPSLARCKRPI